VTVVFAEVTFEGLYKSLDPIGELPDNARQPDEPVGDVLGLCAQFFEVGLEANLMRLDPSHICSKLSLLAQQKLHSPFDLVRRHRLEIHENTPVPLRYYHYAIVFLTRD